MRTLSVLLLALALALVPAGMAGAQSSGETQSEVRTTDESATVEYNHSIGDADYTEQIEFTTNATAFTVSFQRANETGQQVNELTGQLHELAEFEDENENGAYDPDEKVASSYRLSEESEDVLGGPENGTVEWENVTVSDASSDDGTRGKVVHAQASFVGTGNPEGPVDELVDQAPNTTREDKSTFHVRMYVFDQPTTVNGTEVDPGQVKVSLETDNYPYARNDTRLALGLTAQSDQGLENDTRAEEGVKANDNIEDIELDLLYTWNATAEVDGSSAPVGTTRLDAPAGGGGNASERAENETERAYAISYERGDEIVHDPTTGVRITGPADLLDRAEDRASQVPGWGAAVGLSTLAAAAVVASRD